MATKFSPCKGSYVLNQFPSNVMFGINGFHVSASGAIQGHHGPLVLFKACFLSYHKVEKKSPTELHESVILSSADAFILSSSKLCWVGMG